MEESEESKSRLIRIIKRIPNFFMRSAVKAASLAVFYRSLSSMVTVGVRIDRALQLLSDQSDDPHMASICSALALNVLRGHSLSSSMANWPEAFGAIEVRLIQVGEATGKLDKILERLATYEERRHALRMKISSALTYPSFVFILSLVALVIIPPFLFSGLLKMIESFGLELPFVTKLLLFFARLVNNGWVWLIAIIAAIAAFRMLPRTLQQENVRYMLMRRALGVPVVGKALKTIAVTRMARSFEILLGVGISLDQSLRMSFEAADNPVLTKKLPKSLQSLRAGASLTDCLYDADFFPEAFVQMVNVGEESGKLPYLLTKAANMYEQELGYSLDMAVAALEPLMLLTMGLIVGFFIIATMLPMIQIIQHL